MSKGKANGKAGEVGKLDARAYARTLNDGPVDLVPIASGRIKTHPKNPRRGDLEAIKASIGVNGFYGTITANRRTGHILAGNHRYLAARELGFDAVPVVWVDVGRAEEERILAADNRTSDLGVYDNMALASLLEGLAAEAGGLEGTGYRDGDLDELHAGLEPAAEDELEAAFGALPQGDKPPFQNMTFTLHDEQAEEVRRALEVAKSMGAFVETGNENSNGNALARVCEVFLTSMGGRG